MIQRIRLLPIVLVAGICSVCSVPRNAIARDLDYERLSENLDRLAQDPKLAPLVPLQIERARSALQALKESGRKDHPYLVYVTERRIDIARTTAQAELVEDERTALQRENDRLQLEAARRDAEQARRELEHQHLQAEIHAEEAARLAREAQAARAEGEQASQAAEAARAEAEQAKRMADAQAKEAALAKKEAALAAAVAAPEGGPARRSMTLDAAAFVHGKGSLDSAGRARIPALVDFANEAPGSRVRIESRAEGDRRLATERADAVRDALIAAGVSSRRIQTTASAGKGAARVEIRLESTD